MLEPTIYRIRHEHANKYGTDGLMMTIKLICFNIYFSTIMIV